MKKKFFYMKDKIKSKKERKSRKEEKINLNEILKDESYKLGTFRRNGRGFGFVNVGEEDEIFMQKMNLIEIKNIIIFNDLFTKK